MTLPVVEIFDSIQGEGVMVGTPATFIRLAGCNLNCSWCDTTWDIVTELTINEIVEQVTQHLVVITGGEPTLYDLIELTEQLHKSGHMIAIETNGTNPVLGLVDWITCSPKAGYGYRIVPYSVDELKYVVDEYFTVASIELHKPPKFTGPIWLQPEATNMQANFQKCYKLAMKSNGRYRVGVQLHKLMGGGIR